MLPLQLLFYKAFLTNKAISGTPLLKFFNIFTWSHHKSILIVSKCSALRKIGRSRKTLKFWSFPAMTKWHSLLAGEESETDGQRAQKENKVSNLDSVEQFEDLTMKQWFAIGTKLGGVDAVKAVLRGTSSVSVEVICRLSDLLPVTVGGGKRNPHEFFQTRKGLYVWDGFRDNILAASTNKVITTKKTTFGYAGLVQPANDAEIAAELPKDHIFEDVDMFLGHLATLINAQQDGGEGGLLNNGHWNIFYVRVGSEVFAVHVRWNSAASEWNCYAYRLDDFRWDAGYRAFSSDC